MEQFDRQKPSLIPQVLRHVVKATGRTARTATLNTYLYIVVSMAHTYIYCASNCQRYLKIHVTPFQVKRNVCNQILTHSLRLHEIFSEFNCVTSDSPSAPAAHRVSGVGCRATIGSIIYTNHNYVTLRGPN